MDFTPPPPKARVLYIRDSDGDLTRALEREIAYRKANQQVAPSVQALVAETLWASIRQWEDPRRGKTAR